MTNGSKEAFHRWTQTIVIVATFVAGFLANLVIFTAKWQNLEDRLTVVESRQKWVYDQLINRSELLQRLDRMDEDIREQRRMLIQHDERSIETAKRLRNQ